MNALQIMLTILIASLGYPAGLLIAHLAQDELEQGKKWFKLIIAICFIAVIVSIILVAEMETLFFLMAACVFIALMALASLVKAKRIKKQK